MVVAVAIALAGLGTWAVTSATGVADRLEAQTLDWRWQVRGPGEVDRRVAIVAIDDESLQRMRVSWPMSRAIHAQAIRRLTALGARAIVYDIDFDLARTQGEDDELLAALAAAPTVVLPVTQTDGDGGPRFLGGGAANRDASGALFGYDREVRENDGAIRRFAAGERRIGGPGTPVIPSMPVLAADAVSESKVRAPMQEPWVDVAAGPCDLNNQLRGGRFACAVPAYALNALIDGRVRAEDLKDRVVVVGFTSSTLQTLRQTWGGGGRLATALQLQAHEIATVLGGFPLRTPSRGWQWLAILLLAVGPALLALRHERRLMTSVQEPSWVASSARILVIGMGAVAMAAAVSVIAFDAGYVAPVAAPCLGGLVATALAGARAGFVVRRRSLEIWRVTAAMAPEQLVEKVVLETGGTGLFPVMRRSAARPQGVGPITMTIMFADLRGSTAYVSHLLEPAETWLFTQAFQERAVRTVQARGGYVLSLEGDGILAMFGEEFGGAEHARLAVEVAAHLVGDGLDRIRDEIWVSIPRLREPFAARPLGMRVGVHTGEIYLGTSGVAGRLRGRRSGEQPARLAFTTAGFPTHVASKLSKAVAPGNDELWVPESAARVFAGEDFDERVIVVSDVTMQAARAGQPVPTPLDEPFACEQMASSSGLPSTVWVAQGRRAPERSGGALSVGDGAVSLP